MKVTSPRTLARLLLDRLTTAGDPGRALTLAQLLDDHLAYSRVRSELGLAGKGEYDVAILGLLADRTLLQADPALEAAARRELESPEPALAFADALSERLLRLRNPTLPEEPARPGEDGDPGDESTADVDASVEVDPSVGDDASVTDDARGGDDAPAGEGASGREDPPGDRGRQGDGRDELPGVRRPAWEVPATADDPEPDDLGGMSDPVETVAPPPLRPAPPEPAAPAPRAACRSCGEDLPGRDGFRYCPYCGQDQVVPRCTACGETLEPRWSFCPRCGRTTGG
ncbi:MAG: zinc ribbon domain-containing protein [Gemmatimonadota bacterium]|nr:zinc ribbon domain-containing protein [Gemmatimonadota bacterium]